jgi:DNA-binding NarL/FixJ family response regulator
VPARPRALQPVLQEMATGRNNSSIAQVLFMSERAVEKHIGAIFQKLGLSEERDLSRRVAAVITFLEAGGTAPSGRPG